MVSNIFYFHPYLVKWSNLTSIFFRWVGSNPTSARFEEFVQADVKILLAKVHVKVTLDVLASGTNKCGPRTDVYEWIELLTAVSRMKYPQLPRLFSVMYRWVITPFITIVGGPPETEGWIFWYNISQVFFLERPLITRTFVHVTFVKGLLRTYT